jgi:uncharacterized protein
VTGELPARSPREQLVVIQATPFCNLDCSYCYLQDRSNPVRIDGHTLDAVFRQTMEVAEGRPLTYLWHAGEPLVVGVEWFERAWSRAEEAASKYGGEFSFAVQTNGVLLDPAWVEFFASHEVTVGVSVDGPAPIHDAQRQHRNGAPTHEPAMRGVALLQAAEVPVRAICVLSRSSLRAPDDIFHFFAGAGFASVGFNIEETEGLNQNGLDAGAETRSLYRTFMRRFVDLWLGSDAPFRVREFDHMMALLAHADDDVYNTTTTPGDILTFLYDGAYATYCPELAGSTSPRYPRLVMGNVHQNQITQLSENPVFVEITSEIEAGLDKCRRECGYWSVCGGAFPSNKFWETGRFDVSETDFCRLHVQTLADTLLELIDGDSTAWTALLPARSA